MVHVKDLDKNGQIRDFPKYKHDSWVTATSDFPLVSLQMAQWLSGYENFGSTQSGSFEKENTLRLRDEAEAVRA